MGRGMMGEEREVGKREMRRRGAKELAERELGEGERGLDGVETERGRRTNESTNETGKERYKWLV